VKKSIPSEIRNQLKFGSLPTHAEAAPNRKVFVGSDLKFNSQNPIPIKQAFGRLKEHLCPHRVPQTSSEKGSRMERPMEGHSVTGCSHCLHWDHQISDYTFSLRCWGCFDYGHRQRSCLKWHTMSKSKWVPKSKIPVDNHFEPLNDKTDGTKASQSPTLSLR
jgi:hypothetical protein